MTLEDKVGHQLAVGFDGAKITESLVRHLRAIHARALVLFERNYENPDQMTAMIRGLEGQLQRPLLVLVDHEGGRVVRFRNGVTQFPDAQGAARDGSIETVRQQGAVEAKELRQMGIGGNLAPCADVLAEGSDPVIGNRSYGSDAAQVAEFVVARIKALQAGGIAACAKHFPGLGAVNRDPHKRLPTISLDRADLIDGHLGPFRAAIAANVAMVMSSHVCYPKMGDPAGLPATFSANLIQGLLREELGFQGLILTDDLMMGALGALGGPGEVAVRSVAAGHDLLLICEDPKAQKEAFSYLCNQYRYNKLDSNMLDKSVARMRQILATFSRRALL